MRYWLKQGLGDECHFAQVAGTLRLMGQNLACYYPKGHPAYTMAGVPWTGVQATQWVGWGFGRGFNDGTLMGSRIYGNLRHPLVIPDRDACWRRLCETRFGLPARLPSQHEPPVILFHPLGTSLAGAKNLSGPSLYGLINMLAELGTVLLLPTERGLGDQKLPRGPRILPIERRSLEDLATLFRQADIFVGGDSGPFHFSRYFDLPKVFLALRHHPYCVTIPDPQATYLALPHATNGTLPEWRLREWCGYHREAVDATTGLLPPR